MNEKTITRAILLAIVTGVVCAQTVPTPEQPGAVSGAPASDGLKDLDAMTLPCTKAALNAAAREAAKVESQGTYQFGYFSIVAASHHAHYEVHFTSNYNGEPDLNYSVELYCQQGWDAAAAKISVERIAAGSQSGAGKSARCGTHPSAHK